MAKSSESDTNDKNEKTLSQQVLERLKQKEECPRCKEKYLYSGDSSTYDAIMHFDCLRCGHSFYANEQQREYQKDKDKEDKPSNPWGGGFLVLIAMLAVVLVRNLEREGELTNPQPLSPSTEQLR